MIRKIPSLSGGGTAFGLKSREVKAVSAGRWQAIYAELLPDVIPSHKRHQPCPHCGGKDRFRLLPDWENAGAWICNQCCPEVSDGFGLIQRVLACGFREAVLQVAGILALDGTKRLPARPLAVQPSAGDPGKSAEQEKKLCALLARSVPLSESAPALAYLRQRGLGALINNHDLPPGWRAVDALHYWEHNNGKTTRVATTPALVGAVCDPGGKPVACHRTWITERGTKAALPHPRKLTTPVGAGLTGGAVRLYPADDKELAVAEGIETSLAIRVILPGCPVWAAVSAHGLRSIRLPEHIDVVRIMTDKDRSGAGQRAAQDLAERLTQEG